MKFQKAAQTLDDADLQELLHSHAAELTEEDRQQLTVLYSLQTGSLYIIKFSFILQRVCHLQDFQSPKAIIT
jgi:hypothetical protein